MKNIFASILTAIVYLVLVVPALASSTLTLNTVNQHGWVLNPDPTNATPYIFSTAQHSLGMGSLYVEPIAGVAARKFIAAKTLNVPISQFDSLAYDFLIAGNGDASDANQFYLNVYANLPGSSTYYDCRYDYVPSVGSTTNFTTVSYGGASIATNVGDRATDSFTCPTTLDQMELLASGSTIKFVTLNLGDTSLNDTGLAGYFDRFAVSISGEETVYDLEPVIRSASISSPTSNMYPGLVNFTATLVDDDVDAIQWAVRSGTCAAGTGTVFGNVDGHSDMATINTTDLLNQTFSFTGDMTAMPLGMYCFVYNPTEDSGEAGIRLTQQFELVAPPVIVPTSKDECKKDGWMSFSNPTFKNQGQCVSYVMSNEKAGKRN